MRENWAKFLIGGLVVAAIAGAVAYAAKHFGSAPLDEESDEEEAESP